MKIIFSNMGNKTSSYNIKQIGREYNNEMLEILSENPIESAGLSLCFDRNPDIFRMPEIKYNPARFVGFLKEKELLGFGLIGFYNAYVNDRPTTVFHFTDLYVRGSSRRLGFFYKASDLLFKEAFEKQMWGYSIIMHGNKNAESHISRGHDHYPYIPHSKIIGTLDVRNIMITFRKKESKSYQVRKATLNDSDFIVHMLSEEHSKRFFAPYIDDKVFRKNLSKRPDFGIGNYYIAEKDGQAVGVCAAWSCSSFKQTRVLKYGRKIKLTKKIHSILSFFFKIPGLPPKGGSFKEVYITDYAVRERDPKILNALLCRIYNDYRKLNYNTVIFGSYKSDKLLRAVKGFFNQSVKSHIVASSYDPSLLRTASEKSCRPYIDIALL